MNLIEKIDARISVYKEKQSNSDYAGSIAYQNIINGLNDVKQIILSEQKEPCKGCGWIPVSERLPTTDGVFEVTIKGSKGKRRVEMCGFHKDANFDKWGGKYSQLNVIAWRSRPEPWKETV